MTDHKALEDSLGDPEKDRIVETLSGEGSALKKYQTFFIGRPGLGALLHYELTMMLAAGTRGALGYLLRKKLYPGLFARAGAGHELWPGHRAALPGAHGAGG